MSEIIVLSRDDLVSLMRFGDYVDVVTEAFRMHVEGRTYLPLPLYIPADEGGFHVKAASLSSTPGYAAFKTNSNFPQNRRRAGLPTIQGAVLLFDAGDGTLLALLDSIEITLKRTGAATAVAARHLARPNSTRATICGCGEQGRIQLIALRHSLDIRKAFAWDIDSDAATAFVDDMSKQLGIDIEATSDLRRATVASDVIATCTTAKASFLTMDHVKPGTFIAAIGADNPEKSEIAPDLMARAKVVADIVTQCAVMGDLHHAIRAGAMTIETVHAEVGELITGKRSGRTSDGEITIFDGSGTGIQDVAAAARAYELARKSGAGSRVRLT